VFITLALLRLAVAARLRGGCHRPAHWAQRRWWLTPRRWEAAGQVVLRCLLLLPVAVHHKLITPRTRPIPRKAHRRLRSFSPGRYDTTSPIDGRTGHEVRGERM